LAGPKPKKGPQFKERTTKSPEVMFKKAALILTAISLTIANIYAIEPGLVGGRGNLLTHIDEPLTILSADQSSVRASWERHLPKRSGGTITLKQEATFYLTGKTAFSGGTKADAVRGRKVHITYHFDGDHAIADTVTFIHS
jgi:hypothetical protein